MTSLFTPRERFFSRRTCFFTGGIVCIECFDDVEEAPREALEARDCRDSTLRMSDEALLLLVLLLFFPFLTILLDN